MTVEAFAHRHAFTVDVEEWFQVTVFEGIVPRDTWDAQPSRVGRSVDTLLELLDRHRTEATFFTLGWVADRHPDVVRRIAESGHEIASHGWWHRRIPTQTPEEVRKDLRDSRAILEDVTGTRVRGYRAPSFSLVPGKEWVFDLLLEEGYRYDSSLFPIRRPGYGYPTAQRFPHTIEREAGVLKEFPVATARWGGLRLPAAGGGYLRSLPVGLTCRALRQAAGAGETAVIYVHPWEVDPGQPRLEVSPVRRFRHYNGLSGMLSRIERLFEEFAFTSIARLADGDAAVGADAGVPASGSPGDAATG